MVETTSCFSDGVQMVTGCSFGNNSLVYRDYGKTAFSLVKRSGDGVRVSVRPDLGDLLKNKNPEAQSLYLQTVNQRKATPEEEERKDIIKKRLLGGRPNINPVLMIKMLVLQAWYTLSNTELKQQANDRLGFLKLLGHPRTLAICI